MTDATAIPQAVKPSTTGWIFAVAIFTSAALVFSVQPMMTRLVLPTLGGSPSVWNTAMVFFQAALLVGYAYAHLLQRVKSIRWQVGLHVVLLLAALIAFWPLRAHSLGDPDTSQPIGWLLGTLAISVGAPFAVLSATAPLLQAWFARVRQGTVEGENPYVLYAASNLGSFAALIAYPAIIEPTLGLSAQTFSWSVGYAGFIALVLLLGAVVWRRREGAVEPAVLERSPPIPWREKGLWVLVAAAPSSLMLSVTSHLSVDVASAPFLWVIPLALYLLTFVIAFSRRPIIAFPMTLLIHAAATAACLAVISFQNGNWLLLVTVHLVTFFFAALMCHQRLALLRPAPDRLTEFFLLLSLGGVLGGAFTALVAPMIFKTVIEYPLVLCLAVLAQPWSFAKTTRKEWLRFAAILPLCLIPFLLFHWLQTDARPHAWGLGYDMGRRISLAVLGGAAVLAFTLYERKRLLFAGVCMIAISSSQLGTRYDWLATDRSFFGVIRASDVEYPGFGTVRLLMHGTTLHGSQVQLPEWRCRPTLYYANSTPIGQATLAVQRRSPSVVIGVVGEGTGSMAAYKRQADHLSFFEIDPMVDRWARDPALFSYINDCAQGPVRTVIGDARLTLGDERPGTYDLLVIDAFSSDAIPTHMLTVEAIRQYLALLKPDGLLVLHLSNRNLEITTPAISAGREAGAAVMHQIYGENPESPPMTEASTEVVVMSPTSEGLEILRFDPRWTEDPPSDTAPWTDDYVNLFGALVREARR